MVFYSIVNFGIEWDVYFEVDGVGLCLICLVWNLWRVFGFGLWGLGFD